MSTLLSQIRELNDEKSAVPLRERRYHGKVVSFGPERSNLRPYRGRLVDISRPPPKKGPMSPLDIGPSMLSRSFMGRRIGTVPGQGLPGLVPLPPVAKVKIPKRKSVPKPRKKIHKVGSREEVWEGSAERTKGGLTHRDLTINKYGKIVSKKKIEQGLRLMRQLRKIIC